jgi:predicted RNA-binding protein (virulence factor B family)
MPGSDKDAYEGSADLRGGDTVLLFTDGIARKVRVSGSRAAEDVLRVLSRKRREHQLSDDLTAIVIRVNRAGSAMEVVA